MDRRNQSRSVMELKEIGTFSCGALLGKKRRHYSRCLSPPLMLTTEAFVCELPEEKKAERIPCPQPRKKRTG